MSLKFLTAGFTLRKNLRSIYGAGKTVDEGCVFRTARETLQELACVVLALIPKAALLSK